MRPALVLIWTLAFAVVLPACQPKGVGLERPTLSPITDSTSSVQTVGALDPDSGLPFVLLSDLPPEAADTVALIESNGPFPYSQDGAVFQNREGILPDQPAGYYHEYTVVTPGSEDRGARRIVAGGLGAGELYYSDDHYSSFARISR